MDRRTAVKNIALSLGFAVSGSTVISLFNACSADKTTLKPEFFKASDLYSINFLVDILLPVTATIGAKDLNISLFIDKMCKHVVSEEKQKSIRLGAEEFSKRFEQITDKNPLEGNKQDYQQMVTIYFGISEEKEKAVFEMLNEDYNNPPENVQPDYNLYTFLTTIRELNLLGYFTSQTIMERELKT